MSKELDAKREELTNEIKEILKSAEALLDEKSETSTTELKRLRTQLNKQIDDVKGQLSNLKEETVESAKQVVKQTDILVQENPYKAIGVAGVVGLLLGVLISRR
ncbi:DUF883 family protein [Pasteurella bettyae]|uniref:PF05957 family protein n=1 Tax=Pasteurella bettyae CCUG 2042 TaxID=1095749 RepID=I3DBJ8_9PAST|nr:DUF883 family protein [Pasteurella bettyae]EIJ69091.1 PF05957 family protein [Pasteurella bettyae CCUG 2042]SUB22911.1 transmembrane protein [Pasteurella bettyae]